MLRGQCTIIFIQSESKIEINNDTHRCLEQERSLVEPGAVEPATSCISGSRHPPATMDDVSQQCNGTTEIRSNIMTFSVRISLATIRHLSQYRTVNQIKEVFYFWLTLPHPQLQQCTIWHQTTMQNGNQSKHHQYKAGCIYQSDMTHAFLQRSMLEDNNGRARIGKIECVMRLDSWDLLHLFSMSMTFYTNLYKQKYSYEQMTV